MSLIEVVAAEEGQAREELERLAGAGALSRHLSRPRGRPGFALLARRGAATGGYALLAHSRFRLGAAVIEALELSGLAAGGAEVREALIEAAVTAAAAAGLPFLSLRRPVQLFGAHGLAPCALVAQTTLAAPEPGPGLRPVGADDEEDLAALHGAAYAGLPLSPLRTPPDWRWLRAGEGELLAQEDGRGRLTGYALLAPGAGGLVVREAAPADGGAARALLGALGARAGGGPLALELPPGHPLSRAAIQLGGELSLRAPAPGEAARLFGVVDPGAAIGALLPELEARLARSRYAGWSGRISLEGGGVITAVAFEGGRAALARPDLPPDVAVRRVSLGGLAQLLLGYRDAGDLRATGELACADVDLGLLELLFPALLPAG